MPWITCLSFLWFGGVRSWWLTAAQLEIDVTVEISDTLLDHPVYYASISVVLESNRLASLLALLDPTQKWLAWHPFPSQSVYAAQEKRELQPYPSFLPSSTVGQILIIYSAVILREIQSSFFLQIYIGITRSRIHPHVSYMATKQGKILRAPLSWRHKIAQ